MNTRPDDGYWYKLLFGKNFMASEQRPLRREILTWEDVEQVVVVLMKQLREADAFDAMLLVTRGGIIPGGLISEALNIRTVLTAAVRFPEIGAEKLAAWPEFLQFPTKKLLAGKRVLIVDDVWGSGRTMAAVNGGVEAAKGNASTCVFHYNPYRSLFSDMEPDYYGATTDAHIVYPWEIDRGMEGVSLPDLTYN
jgi:hypoxanthine phosphoribosyltransferase